MPERAHLASTLATRQPTTHPTLPVSHRTGENVQGPFIGVHPAPGSVLSTFYGVLIMTAILKVFINITSIFQMRKVRHRLFIIHTHSRPASEPGHGGARVRLSLSEVPVGVPRHPGGSSGVCRKDTPGGWDSCSFRAGARFSIAL